MESEILLALTAGDSPPLGDVWRITAKESDFYLDALSIAGAVHLSIHGPGRSFDGHRFHIKIDRQLASSAKEQGHFVLHGLPRKGLAFDGQEVADRAFRVARLRWTWHLQRPRFRQAAAYGRAPDLTEHQRGARLGDLLKPNEAWDVDLVVSYDKPFWPDAGGSLRDNARLGPLRNASGLWLTATSYHRSQMKYPAPEGLSLQAPKRNEQPSRITGGGLERDATGEMYWFVETITSRELIEGSRTANEGQRDSSP